MNYYHNLVTDKSWKELQRLNKVADFILVGGWAVYLYTQALKSKDIDIIIDFGQLPLLEKEYSLTKNERLKKYEAHREEIQIDIYLPHYSTLGIPVEELNKHTQELKGFTVLKPEYLLVLKIYALSKRGRSPKGRKDFIDAVALIKSNTIDFAKVKQLSKDNKLTGVLEVFKEFLQENFKLQELDINRHRYAQLKKRILSKIN